jgi:hypothetical protein
MDKDVLKIISGIKEIANEILEKDITIVNGFSQRQMEKLAQQTLRVKNAIATGNYSKEKIKFVSEELKRATQNFLNTLIGVVTITIEKILNAVLRFLYGVVGIVV